MARRAAEVQIYLAVGEAKRKTLVHGLQNWVQGYKVFGIAMLYERTKMSLMKAYLPLISKIL